MTSRRDPTTPVRCALRRLVEGQSDRSRRAAHRALRAALRAVQTEAEAEYPLPPRRPARRRRTTDHRVAAEGWTAVSAAEAAALTRAGCAVRPLRRGLVARDWAVELVQRDVPVARIQRAVRSVDYRVALLAEVRLRSEGGEA